MHICIIANGFQEDYITNLLNNLKSKVDKIDFIGSSIHSDRKIDPQIQFYNLRGNHHDNESFVEKFVRIFKYFYRLLVYLHKTKAKIIHVQWIRFHIIEGIFLTLYMKAIGKKVVYTAHDILPRSKNNTYNRIVFKFLYKIQNLIIVHTSYIRTTIITEFKINPSKIYTVAHGIYQREDRGITREKARKYLGLPDSSIVILFFGIIAEYKGFDILLESLSSIDKKYCFQVLIAGKVKLEYKSQFEKLVKVYNSDKLVFLVRYIRDEEVEYCFKAANVTVLPYKEASQSGVMFMSYAYGIPVIAPSLGGFPEDILPGKTGYLFKPNDSESLAKVLLKFNQEWEITDGNASSFIKDHAKSNYAWDKSCDQIVTLYRILEK